MFRFTIRDVLWLTVVVALGVAWWIDHQRPRSPNQWQLRAESLAEICRGYGWTVAWQGDGVNGAFPPVIEQKASPAKN